MLKQISNSIERRPWLYIGVILLITIGFGLFLPTLEMQTSMENFLPEDDVVLANERINNYFGAEYEIVMMYIEKDKTDSVTSVKSLREINQITKKIESIENVEGSMSIIGFIDTVCQLEFGESFENCSDEQIQIAFDDLIAQKDDNIDIKMIDKDDSNEEIDFQTRSIISKGKSIDSIDIKNYIISESDEKFNFSIEVYDLSKMESEIDSPYKKLNVYEWYVSFKNLIIPYEELDMDYTIAAHIEPTNPIWEIGKKPLKNLFDIISLIRNRQLFNSFKSNAVLWITPPGQELSFPITLESGEVVFNKEKNTIEISVNKSELGNYGIAPQIGNFGLPARIGNTKAGFRYYKISKLDIPWLRFSFNMSFIQKYIERIQRKPIIGRLTERLLSRSGTFSWDDLTNMSSSLGEGNLGIDSISFKDMSLFWVVADEAPDNGNSPYSILIKPSFMDDMGKNVNTFLSNEFNVTGKAEKMFMMVYINGTLSNEELASKSKEIVNLIDEEDAKLTYIKIKATSNSFMENEITSVMMDSNQIIIPSIFIVISIILLFSFRRLSYVFLPLLGLTIAIIWLFGTMAVIGLPFMVMEVALIPMLMGLGVDYSVHLFHNYRTELAKGKKPSVAIVSSIQDIGIAMLLATITTFIAFLSFLSATMVPLRDFGVLTALGIAYIFIITITFQAPVRYVLDNRKRVINKIKPKKDPNGKIMRRTAKLICNHPIPILLITIIITIVMIGGAIQIETGFRMEDFLPEESPSVTVMMDISENFPFSSQEKEYILIEGEVATIETLNGIYKSQRNLRDDTYIQIDIDGDPKVNSILNIIQKEMKQNNSFKTRFNLNNYGIPSTDSDVKNIFDFLYDNQLYSYEVRELLHKENGDYDATLVSVYTNIVNNDDEDINQAMKLLYEELNEDISNVFESSDAIITGENSMMYVIMNSMTESQILSTTICLILAAVVLIIAYRKPILGLIAMIPVLISTVWIVGTMHFIGYNLNIMTIMITSMTIGLGITYAIHAIERFRLVADKTGNVIEAVSETIGHTGSALTIAAITTIAGFGMLILTPMPVEQQFGVITALTIAYALLTSLFIMPPILLFWGKWKKNKKGYIISPGKPKK